MTERTPRTAGTEAEDRPAPPPVGAEGPSSWRRIGWRLLLVLAAVAWVAIGAYLLFGGPEEEAEEDGAAAEARDAPAPLLWIVRGSEGRPPAMALLHAHPEEPVVALLPVGTLLEVPGQGPRPLEAALVESGPLGVSTAVANSLGVRVPRVLVAAPEQFATFVDEVGPVEVDVPETIEVEEEGVLRRVFTEGPTRMDGAELVGFLTRIFPEGRETDRVARQGAAWRGLFGVLGDEDVPSLAGLLEGWESGLSPDRASRFLREVAQGGGGLRILTLPVRRSPAPGDLYEVEEEQLGFLREALVGIRTVEDPSGRRLRLLVGAEGQVGPAIAKELVEAGYRFVLTGRASRGYDVSRVVMAENSDELRQTAQDLLDLLGTGRLGVDERRQTLFDVTLVVGRDWAEANGFPQAGPTPEGSAPEGD